MARSREYEIPLPAAGCNGLLMVEDRWDLPAADFPSGYPPISHGVMIRRARLMGMAKPMP